MELFERRFLDLSVSDKDLVYQSVGPSNKLIKKIGNYIFNIYSSLPICKIFGKDSIKYVADLSTRYALWTLLEMKTNKRAIKNFSLWLSIIWLIDGVFDKYQKKISSEYKRQVVSIISNLYYPNDKSKSNYNKDELDKDDSPKSSELLTYLSDTVEIVYSKYMEKISKYRNTAAYSQIEVWTGVYLDTLPTSDTITKIDKLDEYEKWRLNSGAIMCVIWHYIMFKNVEHVSIQDIKLFEKASIVISYHNDILSYNRDKKDGTPNLVNILGNGMMNEFELFGNAIDYVNDYYKKLRKSIDQHNEQILNILLSVLEGSYNWTNNEARYKVGLRLVQLFKDGKINEFDIILKGEDHTPGDPI